MNSDNRPIESPVQTVFFEFANHNKHDIISKEEINE